MKQPQAFPKQYQRHRGLYYTENKVRTSRLNAHRLSNLEMAVWN
jgi:hypothetical protein